MSSSPVSDKTKITLMALRHPFGQQKVMSVLKSAMFAASISGTAHDLRFLVETAQLLPEPKVAARFLALLGMVRERMESQGAMEDLVPGEPSFALSVRGVLEEAERETRSGFREEELESASAAIDVIES